MTTEFTTSMTTPAPYQQVNCSLPSFRTSFQPSSTTLPQDIPSSTIEFTTPSTTTTTTYQMPETTTVLDVQTTSIESTTMAPVTAAQPYL